MVTDFAFREDFRSLRSQLELAASLDEKLKCVKSRNDPPTTHPPTDDKPLLDSERRVE